MPDMKLPTAVPFKQWKRIAITVFEQSLKVSKPKLWSLENPALYHVESKVQVNDNMSIDARVTPFGIRTFEFTIDKGFFLNGKHVAIQGRVRAS